MSANKCVNCGMCKGNCPILVAEKNEGTSPRSRVTLLRDKIKSELIFKCTLCNACKSYCPVGIDIPEEIREARSAIETEKNKKMIENIRAFGNPFGKVDGEVTELHCC